MIQPDKIYCGDNGHGNLSFSTEKVYDTMQEYIRKGAVREKLQFAKSVYDHPNRVLHGVADGFRQDGRTAMCDDLLSWIDTLGEKSEVPTNPVDLEKEIKRYLQEVYDRDTTVSDVARHFAEWGAEHLKK